MLTARVYFILYYFISFIILLVESDFWNQPLHFEYKAQFCWNKQFSKFDHQGSQNGGSIFYEDTGDVSISMYLYLCWKRIKKKNKDNLGNFKLPSTRGDLSLDA